MFKNTITLSRNQKIAIAAVIVAIIVAGRLLPHAWNMTPVVAGALFAGVYLGRAYAVLVPLTGMLLADIFIGFYEPQLIAVVYGSLLLIGLYAFSQRKAMTNTHLFSMTVGSSCFFFLTTNWAVWQFSAWYPPTVDGLLTALAMGIPFFKNAIVGDLLYTGMFFGAYAVAIQVHNYYYASSQESRLLA